MSTIDSAASPRASARRAVVIGASMGGLCAARALADHYAEVVVLERDTLPSEPVSRPGTPQAKHVHVLLAGGLQALESLFPGVEGDLQRAGAVPVRAGLDIRIERPGFDPFPQRDAGFHSYSMSRDLLEHTVRQRAARHDNVELRSACRVLAILPADDGAVRGVRFEKAGGSAEELEADIVVDASGRGSFSLDFLSATGRALPPETTVGVDVGYATLLFAVPDDAPSDWVSVMHMPLAPQSSRGAFLFRIEGGRWMAAIGGRGDEKPPGDLEGFMDFARAFRTPTIYEALRGARPLGDAVRFAFQASVRRHYARLDDFPRGLLPFGDAICRFNPLYGQGMSVVALEACALRGLLGQPGALAPAFFAAADELIDTPWAMSALPDFIYPQTVGERPPDLMAALGYGMALNRLAATDPALHKLTLEVQHLLKPRSLLRTPEVAARVMAAMG